MNVYEGLRLTVPIERTRYRGTDRPGDDGSPILAEILEHGTMDFRIEVNLHDGELWLHADPGYESIRVARIGEAIERGGWAACFGTPPVYIAACRHPDLAPECCGRVCQHPQGGWHGSTYDRILVPADSLRAVQAEMAAWLGRAL